MVLQGAWWVGWGTKFDPDKGTTPMPAGSFVTHFGKQIHWDGAKDEEAVLLIVGDGPATTPRVPFEEGKCSAPLVAREPRGHASFQSKRCLISWARRGRPGPPTGGRATGQP